MTKKIIILLLLPYILFASIIKDFTMMTNSNKVNQNGVATVIATLRTTKMAKVTIPQFPESNEYRVLGSSSRTSSSSSIQIINGRRTSTREVETIFYYKIQFLKEGKVTLPPLTVQVKNESISTSPIEFFVGGERNVQKDIPITFSYVRPKSTLYINEQIPLKLRWLIKAGTGANLTNEGLQDVYKKVLDALEGKFSVTTTSEQVDQSQKIINGVQYSVVSLDLSLTAIDTGKVVIPPIPYSYVKRSRSRSYDAFGFPTSLFDSFTTTDESTVTPRLVLRVISPKDAPKGYTGIVGRVHLKGSISNDTVKVGDGITLKYRLSGRMKASALGSLELPKLQDFEMFPPERKVVSDTTGGKISTRKTVNYMIIPKKEGEYTIPAVKVIWFDPRSGTYKTEVAGPYKVVVLKSDKKVSEPKRYLTKEQIATVGSDIHFIKTRLSNSDITLKPYKSLVIIALLVIPWVLIILLILYKLSIKIMPKDKDKEIRKGAIGKAFKELDKIEKGTLELSPSFVIDKFLNKKYSIPASSMKRDELRETLQKRGASSETVDTLFSFYDTVDASRYGGTTTKEEFNKEAKAILKKIAKEVK